MDDSFAHQRPIQDNNDPRLQDLESLAPCEMTYAEGIVHNTRTHHAVGPLGHVLAKSNSGNLEELPVLGEVQV
jgi:hypothetical protein